VERNLGAVRGDPVFAAVRQIAYEMQKTDDRHLRGLIVVMDAPGKRAQ
jgi:hypothetical protein